MSEEPNWTRRRLERARITDDPEGDLITDMRTEPDIPEFPDLKSMRDYVRFKRMGDRLILAAVPGAWRRYRSWMDRHQADPSRLPLDRIR